MKFIFFIFSLLLMCNTTIAQNNSPADSITVYVNSIACGTYVFKGDEQATPLTIKKTVFKKVKTFTLVVKGNSINNARYKRTVEAALTPAVMMDETKDSPGHFNLFNATLIKQLNTAKKIPLYLVMVPANPMMMIPSKRLFMGTLQLQ